MKSETDAGRPPLSSIRITLYPTAVDRLPEPPSATTAYSVGSVADAPRVQNVSPSGAEPAGSNKIGGSLLSHRARSATPG